MSVLIGRKKKARRKASVEVCVVGITVSCASPYQHSDKSWANKNTFQRVYFCCWESIFKCGSHPLWRSTSSWWPYWRWASSSASAAWTASPPAIRDTSWSWKMQEYARNLLKLWKARIAMEMDKKINQHLYVCHYGIKTSPQFVQGCVRANLAKSSPIRAIVANRSQLGPIALNQSQSGLIRTNQGKSGQRKL